MQYLQSNGLSLTAKNYRCQMGEIDLVMKDAEQLVFVEVKSRLNDHHGNAAEFFDAAKRRKMEKAIYHFLQNQGLNPHMTDFRIDLIAITGNNINWLKAI